MRFFFRWKVTAPVFTLRSCRAIENVNFGIRMSIAENGTTDLDVDFVTAENDGDGLADSLEVSVPVGNVLVGDFGRDIEHDDTALTLHGAYQHAVLCRVVVKDKGVTVEKNNEEGI